MRYGNEKPVEGAQFVDHASEQVLVAVLERLGQQGEPERAPSTRRRNSGSARVRCGAIVSHRASVSP